MALNDQEPIYLQILRFVKQGIAAGLVTDGDELPSRRMLSTLLGVNPNTVQKAYSILEEEGLIVSRMGAKSCIVLHEEQYQKVRKDLVKEVSAKTVAEFTKLGFNLEETLAQIREVWETEDEE